MNIFRSLSGILAVELTSADISNILSAVNRSGIHLYSVEYVSDITSRMKISRHDYPLFQQIVYAKGCELSIIGKIGIYWSAKRLLCRPILVLGLMVLMLMALFMPGRVYFIQVDGNVDLPDKFILSEAESCGIHFGASREIIRSEKVKNALLAQIPELQWAGVNTKGCVAVISVREKTKTKEIPDKKSISRIIADRDGVIVSCTTEQGNSLCSVGQAVRKGDVLISGYTDCGLSIRACRAIGEVYAQTNRQITTISPRKYRLQSEILYSEEKIALVIGKKRINFYKDSGILGATYDKMSCEKKLTLPGGFFLPVSVITENWTVYKDSPVEYLPNAAKGLLEVFSKSYLTQSMVAGRILQEQLDHSNDEDIFCMQGNYACLEMIGREQQEEILIDYGKNN